MPAALGHDVRVNYLWEDAGYAASPNDSTHKTFGANVKFNRAEASNDPVKLFDPNDREAAKILAQRFSGSWSVEFTMTNPWWLASIFGTPTNDSATSAPYTWTFDGKYGDSMRIILGMEHASEQRILKGCIVRSATIDVAVNDTVNVSLDGFYAEEEIDTTGVGPTQTTFEDDPYTFAEASFKLDSTAVNLTQNVSLSIENNVDPIGELGTRFTADYAPKVRAPSVSFSKIEKDNQDEVERLYGGAGQTTPQSRPENEAPVTIKFDNGGSAGTLQTTTFSIGGAFRESYSLSGMADPEQQLRSDINEMARTITATAKNDTSTAK